MDDLIGGGLRFSVQIERLNALGLNDRSLRRRPFRSWGARGARGFLVVVLVVVAIFNP